MLQCDVRLMEEKGQVLPYVQKLPTMFYFLFSRETMSFNSFVIIGVDLTTSSMHSSTWDKLLV